MQIVRFKTTTNTSYGALEGGDVVQYSGTPWSPFRRGRRRLALKHAVLLTPTLPSKIVGIELNYRCRAAETERTAPAEPRFFWKPTTTLVGPGDPIVYPTLSALVEHGAGLAVVIKRRCRNVPAERVREYVLGYTCLNDVTARDLQAKGFGLRAKGFDTFCPLGPCIATDIDPDAVAIETYVHQEPDLPRRGDRGAHRSSHDAPAGRRDRDRDAGRRGAARAGRPCRGADRGDREPEEHGREALMGDKLLLEDVRFYGQHGLTRAEQVVGAWFSVDVEMAVDLASAVASDQVSTTVDYGVVARRIVEIGTRNRVNLIERLAGLIVEALLREFPAREIRVRVRKLTPPLEGLIGTPAVELTRSRS